jgi:hypothetical protein
MKSSGPAIRKEAALLMEAFAKALSTSLDEALATVDDEDVLHEPEYEEHLHNIAQNDLQEWFSTPLAGLAGRTPGSVLEALDSLATTMVFFEEAVLHCDDEIPDPLKLKLGSFGTAAADALMTLALAPSWEAVSESVERPLAQLVAARAVALLGEWGTKDALELLAAKFSSLTEPDESLAESFRDYCKAIGPDAARVLAGYVETAARAESGGLEGPYDYMLIAIADIGRLHPDDRLFQCLRTAFRRMEHKAVGAICLGDYGDGRAVPTLKGFLDRFEGRIDRQTFYEVTNAIRRLGGVLTDIRNPFASDGEQPS